MPDVTGIGRSRAAGTVVEASRIHGGVRGGSPVVAVGSLKAQLTIGVVTVPRHGEEKPKFFLSLAVKG